MKILVLCTFPVDNPIHGGQHRVYNVVKVFEQAGHDVQLAGVLGSLDYLQSSGFVSYPDMKDMQELIANPFLMDDWAISELFSSNDNYYLSLVKKITLPIDLIYLEGPWLFKFAERMVAERGLNIPIIYSQANFESVLKYDILRKYYDEEVSIDGGKRVLETEVHALNHATWVMALSAADKLWAAERTNRPITLATTGVAERLSDATGRAAAAQLVGSHKYVLFCGSAHPPNVFGFYEYFSSGLGFLSPDERMVVVGDAGSAIQQSEHFSKVPGLDRAFINAGRVPENTLQAIIENAHVIILPITQGGGGANLKTAEAIVSNKYVVATTTAMRGFEEFSNISGLYIKNDPTDFRNAIRICMDSPSNVIKEEEMAFRRKLLWESTLAPLADLVVQLKR